MEEASIFGIIITVIMGFGWGSFATMATYRIPRNMPWIGDKPRCFMCKAELNLLDYFSVFSYFLLKGKCRHCGGKYECSLSYFITEFAITFFFVLCYLQYGFGDLFFLMTSMIVALTILAVVDAENNRIPAKILITTLFIGAVYRTFMDHTFYGALYGGLTAGIIGLFIRHIYYYVIGQKEIGWDYTKWQHEDRFIGPGFDYVKMLAICGVFLSFEQLAVFIAAAGLLTFVWRIIHAKSLRPGAIMAVLLAVFVIYPGFVDYSLYL